MYLCTCCGGDGKWKKKKPTNGSVPQQNTLVILYTEKHTHTYTHTYIHTHTTTHTHFSISQFNVLYSAGWGKKNRKRTHKTKSPSFHRSQHLLGLSSLLLLGQGTLAQTNVQVQGLGLGKVVRHGAREPAQQLVDDVAVRVCLVADGLDGLFAVGGEEGGVERSARCICVCVCVCVCV